MTRLRRPRSAVLSLLRLAVALVILFEEWGWEPLQRLMARLARLPLLAWLERRVGPVGDLDHRRAAQGRVPHRQHPVSR